MSTKRKPQFHNENGASQTPMKLGHEKSAMQTSQVPVRLLTVQAAADFAQVSEKTVRRLIAAGKLRFIPMGKGIRLDPYDIMALKTAR